MANVKVEEQSLIDIGNALRTKLGATKTIQVPGEPRPVVKISKTPNALNFTEYDGDYPSNANLSDTVTIPGAVKIHIKMAYETEGSSWDYVRVYASGTTSTVSYGDNPISQIELDFSNTDTIIFDFISDGSNCNYLGYYAEITGFDAVGNPVMETPMVDKEVPNNFKPAEMGPAIENIPVPNLYYPNYYKDFPSKLRPTGSDWINIGDGWHYARDYNFSEAVKPEDCNWIVMFNTYSGAFNSERMGIASPMFQLGTSFDTKKNEFQEIGKMMFTNVTNFDNAYTPLHHLVGTSGGEYIKYNPVTQVLRVEYTGAVYQYLNKPSTDFVKIMPVAQRG